MGRKRLPQAVVVDDQGVGRLLLLAGQRRNWRQVDVARAAEVSQQLVSVAESGAVERVRRRVEAHKTAHGGE